MTNATAFTQSNIGKLPTPEAGRVFHYDAETKGLAIRVSANGDRVFYVYRKFQGSPVKIALGAFDPSVPASQEITRGTKEKPGDPLALLGNTPTLNLRMARQLARAVITELDKGQNPAAKKKGMRRAAAEELTLGAAYDLYESEHLIPNGKKTVTIMRDDFARYLGNVPPGIKKKKGRERTKPAGAVDWEKRRISTIKPADVRLLMAGLKNGSSARTANRVYTMLKAVYRKLVAWELYAGPLPTDGIQKYPERDRERFIRADELKPFFDALANSKSEDFRHFVLLSLATGARKGNVMAMAWADIDQASNLWTIPGEFSKNGVPMTVPITAAAAEVLAARRGNKSDWVFPANSASGHMREPRKHWVALLEEAKLEDVRLHDLRRSLGSWATMTGASLTIVGAALGHKSPMATRIYARLQTDPIRAAMELAQSAMFEHGGIKKPAPVASVEDQRKKARTAARKKKVAA